MATAARDRPVRAALVGLVVNALLALAKLLAGVFGNSYALIADAAESLTDLVGSAVIWRAFRFGDKPADEGHPSGHGKVEALAAVAVGLLVCITALGVGAGAVRQLAVPPLPPQPYTLAVLFVVITVKLALAAYARRAARQTGSTAGFTDAWHHQADAITSLVTMVGVSIAVLGGAGYASADEWAALLACGVIFINGMRLLRAPLAELVDAHLPDVAERVIAATITLPQVRRIETCEVRRSGRGYHIVLHVEVDPDMTVHTSHRLTGVIKHHLRTSLPGIDSVLVHVEPHEPQG